MKLNIPGKPKITLKPVRGGLRDLSGWILVILAIGLLLMPFVATLNDVLTRLVFSLRGYRLISEIIVPWEVKWVVVILRLLGVKAQATQQYVLITQGSRQQLVEIIWNCVGWQSLIMFAITAMVGLSKRYTRVSKLKALLLGLVGTFGVNIGRMVVIILLFDFLGQRAALVFHNYGALLTNTAWLLFFWWFVYHFILDEGQPHRSAV